jgi:nucleoside-diphosphate-sugar epimerase
MKILIIGGTGFISGYLTRELLERGHAVTLLNRGRSQNPFVEPGSVKILSGDRNSTGSLRSAVGNEMFDAVYDMIAYTPAQTSAAVQVFKGRTGRFVHCSTISVYMVSDKVRCPITEDQDKLPLMEFWERNPFGMQYGIDKRKCEDLLWEEHDARTFPVSMIRPPYVSGPNDVMRRDWFWIQRILDGLPLLVPGSGDHALQVVYARDLARAFAALLDAGGSIGRAYTVAGDDVFSLNEYIDMVGSLVGSVPEKVHLDQDIFDAHPISYLAGYDVFPFNARRTAIFDTSKAKRDLGFSPTPFDIWERETIEWYTKVNRKDSPGYERRKTELQMIDIIRSHTSSSTQILKDKLSTVTV